MFHPPRPTRIEGVRYESASAAARSLAISVQTLIARITSPSSAWDNWHYDDNEPVTVRRQISKPRLKLWCMYKYVHTPSGRFYVGSTGDLIGRLYVHKSNLRRNRHHCKPLQEAFNADPDEHHWSVDTVIAADKKVARALEHDILTGTNYDGLRLNTALDAYSPIDHYNSRPGVGQARSERARNLSGAQAVIQRAGLERGRVTRWQGDTSKEAFSGGNNPHARGVRVHGVEYSSVRLACTATGVGEKRIRQCANVGVEGFEWLSPEPKRFKAIEVDGVVYSSLKEAGTKTPYGLCYLRRSANEKQNPQIRWAMPSAA